MQPSELAGWALATCIGVALIPLVLWVLLFTWPFWLCCYFGAPAIGVLAEVIWLWALNH